MTRPAVVVIGGGIIGLSAAWRLAQKGAKVRVFDSGAPAATFAAAGMLAPSFEAGPAAPLFAFSRRSLALWRDFAAELEAESGLAIDFRADGALGVATSEEEAQALRTRAAALEDRGVRVEWLGPDDVAKAEPSLRPGLVGGLFAPDDGEVDPRRALQALGAALARRGVVVEPARVERIGARRGGVDIICADRAVIAADTAVLAAGSLASRIAGAPGLAGAVFPVKGEALALAAPAALLRRVVRSEGAYLCPKADGRIVIGATSLPGDASVEVDSTRIEALRAAAEAICPALQPLAEQERWSGLRPATADGAPIIGRDALGPEGLLYALGHYRNGVLLAPATAAAVAALAFGGDADPALATFAPRGAS